MKRLIRTLIYTGALSVVALPVFAQAQSPDDRDAALCGQLAAHRQAVEADFGRRLVTFRQAAQAQADALVDQEAAIDVSLGRLQQKYDEHFKQWFVNKQQRSADQDLHKLEVFEREVEKLVQSQRQGLAEARSQFRQAVSQLVSRRQTAAEEKAAVFQQRVTQAFDNARLACGRNQAVRQVFIQELRSARLAYADFRRSQASFTEEIGRLSEVRSETVQAIKHTYEQGFQKAYGEYTSE